MPIHIMGKKLHFEEAVKMLKRTRPDIKSPGGYVFAVEKRQGLAKKKKKK